MFCQGQNINFQIFVNFPFFKKNPKNLTFCPFLANISKKGL